MGKIYQLYEACCNECERKEACPKSSKGELCASFKREFTATVIRETDNRDSGFVRDVLKEVGA